MKQNKQKALEALLDSATLSEAAERAGIARRTLYSYIRDDGEFAQAYKAAQERMTLERIESVEADRRRALDTIFALMDDAKQPGAIRLKAAQTILDATAATLEKADAIAARNVEANRSPLDIFGLEH